MTSTFRQEHPDAALARDLVPPKLINTTRPWNGVPPKPIDKRRHYCSIKPVTTMTNSYTQSPDIAVRPQVISGNVELHRCHR
ncbi:hypothetical protein, partial [Streptomyces lunaelactis]